MLSSASQMMALATGSGTYQLLAAAVATGPIWSSLAEKSAIPPVMSLMTDSNCALLDPTG